MARSRLSRRDSGLFGHWWWTIDRYLLGAIVLLMLLGAVLVSAGSPPVAERNGYDPYHFIGRQYIFLGLGFIAMVVLSFLGPRALRRISVFGVGVFLVLMVLVLFIGDETKGATRWINFPGFTVQPSEFMKPFFAVVLAWIFSLRQKNELFPSFKLSVVLYGVVALLLILQPDVGMTLTISVVWGVQMFLAGLPMLWVVILGVAGIAGAVGAYYGLSHVRDRVDRFLDPSSGDNYQVERSIEAFQNGGLLGKGPGEGEVKLVLPDSHTDFIFAVAGEEFGLLFCLFIIGVFFFIMMRSLFRLKQEQDLFIMLAVAGLVTQFGVQALINMGVSVQMLPAKGMTLPFLSYGGSSVLAVSLAMGMILGLTRKRFGTEKLG